MATISLNDVGAEVEGPIHFTLTGADFDLADSNATYETDDASVIAAASVHPWLSVEVEVDGDSSAEAARKQAEEAANSDDPFVNPSADHLRTEASDEAIDKARKANEATQAAHHDQLPAEEPVTDEVPPEPASPQPAVRFGSTTSSDSSGDNE